MRLSSKHLALASAYFQKSMDGFKNTTAQGQYSYTIKTQDYDEEALLILMNLFHGETAKVPSSVSLETLAKISIMVHHYQCYNAVNFFMRTWLHHLGKVASKGRNALYNLCVSWVFQDAKAFLTSTAGVIKTSEGSLDHIGLPISQHAIGKPKWNPCFEDSNEAC